MKKKFNSIAGLVILAGLLLGFQQKTPTENTQSKIGMIKVTILYPNGEGNKFDMDYYSNKHMPMIANLMGESLKTFAIDKGISGRTPADPIPYLAIGYLYFDNLASYQNAFKPHAENILNDIPNYTNIQPVVQISEVLR
jgi:uncharacterized protein (TIGR02118 family)